LKKPLFGHRVVVTRPRKQAEELCQRIEDLGGEPWEFPTIKVLPPLDWFPLDRALAALETYCWLIFTSVNGVVSFDAAEKALRQSRI